MVNPKNVVLAVMTVEKKETKTVTEKGKDVEREFVTLRCPKPSCAVKLVTIKEKSGYMNPFSHLRSCAPALLLWKRKDAHAAGRHPSAHVQ